MFRTTFSGLFAAALLCAGLGFTQSAGAVSCTGDRVFSITTSPDSTCVATGAGNISGNPGGANPDPLFSILGTDYVLLDKSDDGSSGLLPSALTIVQTTSTSGTFSFVADGFTDIVIAFKSGFAQIIPVWAAFLLPDGVTFGSYSFTGQQGLSHVNLYGIRGVTEIPLPAGIVLMLTALGGLAMVGRRRRETVEAA